MAMPFMLYQLFVGFCRAVVVPRRGGMPLPAP
ncbi:hypothetical protein GGE06_001936 [Streptomyces sp. SFB5A]|uniref:Uncharacterized protein n=1 Tax=Streptomyces nymphaeiformis TaxID=2663842 RepID=A0A7W7TXF4_9ACTN|nr:hypothetical protein [Streptomyces nymphaeiformis]